jgi:hypothetical protein
MGDSMGNPNDSEKKQSRKPYEKPTVTKMNSEEAKRRLVHLVNKGDEDAKEMLQLMFPEEAKKQSKQKKSA